MSERYTKLFSLPENLYATGSPVLIAAGALLKDNQTGKVLAQLKMRSIVDKGIKTATVRLSPFDTVGQPIGDAVEHQYLDLTAERDGDFGQKEPVTFPEAATRSFEVGVTEVIFSDNSTWKATGEPWEPLQEPTKLVDTIEDKELLKQYRLTFGNDCNYTAVEVKDLWYCTCGALNRGEEECCHKCERNLTALKSIDFTALTAERDDRLQKERDNSERKARQQRKVAKIIIPLVAIAIVASVLITGNAKKSNAYDEALLLLSEENYSEALSAFEELGGYKDSAERVNELKYNLAVKEFEENGLYDEVLGLSEEDDTPSYVYTWLCELPEEYENVAELKRVCEEYLPYCGQYALKGNNDATKGISFGLTSNFKYDSDNGLVFWVPDGWGSDSIFFDEDTDCLTGNIPIRSDGKANKTYKTKKNGFICETTATFNENGAIEIRCSSDWKSGTESGTLIGEFIATKNQTIG